MGWILKLDVDADDAELASSLLWDLGTDGVAHLEPAPGRVQLLAGFETEPEASAAADGVRSSLSVWAAAVEALDPTAWADPERTTEETVAGRRIVLRPGAAFGDGGHPSTRLCLDLLAAEAEGRPLGPVLDFGAGTGVLTLAALAHGAPAATAVENDPAALAALRHTLDANAELIAGRAITVATELTDPADADPDPTSVVDGRRASGRGGDPNAAGRFDLLLVNVLLPVHRAMASRLMAARTADATVIVAGVLVEQEAEVLAAYPGLAVRRRAAEGDWLGLVLGPADGTADGGSRA
ncbi:MAG: 50S ribosomal protein L11 methyltransferase [Actinomycetota bacterium]